MKSRKKILVINGHPDRESLSAALGGAYADGARAGGHEVRALALADISFDPVLWKGYREIQELEPDLARARDYIGESDHLVFSYPIWWGVPPALMKGFIDRVFLPGFAFRSSRSNLPPEKLLKGKSARLLVTMDSPFWYYRFVAGRPGHNMMKRGTLEFCGIQPVGITEFTPVKASTPSKRQRWMERAHGLGYRAL